MHGLDTHLLRLQRQAGAPSNQQALIFTSHGRHPVRPHSLGHVLVLTSTLLEVHYNETKMSMLLRLATQCLPDFYLEMRLNTCAGGPKGWSRCWWDIATDVPADQKHLLLGGTCIRKRHFKRLVICEFLT